MLIPTIRSPELGKLQTLCQALIAHAVILETPASSNVAVLPRVTSRQIRGTIVSSLGVTAPFLEAPSGPLFMSQWLG